MNKMSSAKFEECIATLPLEQHNLVRTCFESAKARTKNGRRYTADWVYECLLMKIKSPKLYRKLRRENKLPLPHECTLRRYIKKLHPAYGFQESTFHLLREKACHFSESERHGCLLLDEMALEEGVSFQRDSLEVLGFVDLGQHTPEASKEKRGNHALVLMYQLYKGKWFQTIGAFLSAGAVSGKILEKIIVEAIILLENEGFHVDNVTTDGATWNRAMWETFGISNKKSYCQHPSDPMRNLWFASDFPHLVKNSWTRIVNKKSLDLPEGVIKLSHWEAVLKEDAKKGIKVCYTLETAHVTPTNYQRMNTNLAIRFFGHSVAVAMEFYRQQGVRELQDCQASVAFIERMNSVIEAMNSRKPWKALICSPETIHYKTLTSFLTYLDELADMAAAKRGKTAKKIVDCKIDKVKNNLSKKIQMGADNEFTLSTYLGFVVTVRTAVEMVSYLEKEVGYSYLMTRRINQDALEHFFGEMRGACGSSTHLDPLMFIQVYRLISTYSLVKPLRGSNVSGGELLTGLKDKNLKHQKDLHEKIDNIINNTDMNFIPDNHIENDHNYLATPIDSNALTVFAGYIARKMLKTRQCQECNECSKAVCASEDADLQDRENLLNLKSYGGLLRPSNELFSLVFQLEESISKTVPSERLNRSTIFSILDGILSGGEITRVGCQEHEKKIIYNVVSFYLTCRMHFVCAAFNKAAEQKKK